MLLLSRIVTLWNEVDISLNIFAPGGGPAVALPHAVAEEPADLVAALPEDGGALAGHDAPAPAHPVPPAAVALLPLEAREEVASRPRKVAVRVGGLGRLVVKGKYLLPERAGQWLLIILFRWNEIIKTRIVSTHIYPTAHTYISAQKLSLSEAYE